MILLNQVNIFLLRRNPFNKFMRLSHNDSSTILYPLNSRKLLKIRGKDTPTFLQGLITNDMRHFEEGAKSIYAMFLNNKGRVLYDTLIHKWEGDSFLIECDKEVHMMLHRHLKLFKLKRAVDLEEINNYNVWALIMSPNKNLDNVIQSPSEPFTIYKDPRLPDLGYRVLSIDNLNKSAIEEKVGSEIIIENDGQGYQYLRYKLGVSEGAADLPPGTCFPLEVNCDYLHGVSFHKGCYIGQELTARVHHTGVVRKRIMPLKFNQSPDESLNMETIITANNNPKSNVGKLKGFVKNHGIGLIRIKEALDAKSLQIGNQSIEVVKPSWWPIEAPKEKISKNE